MRMFISIVDNGTYNALARKGDRKKRMLQRKIDSIQQQEKVEKY